MGLRRCGLGSLIGQPGAAPPLGTEPVGNSGAGYAGPPAAASAAASTTASTTARAIHGGPAGQVRQQGGQPGSWTRASAWARCSGPGHRPQQHHPGEVIARGDRQARRNRRTANVAAPQGRHLAGGGSPGGGSSGGGADHLAVRSFEDMSAYALTVQLRALYVSFLIHKEPPGFKWNLADKPSKIFSVSFRNALAR